MVKRQSAVQSKQAEGAGVVVISSYFPEILAVSNRILVARGGTIVAEFTRDEATPEKILHAAIH
jgi:ABC-type sugar transport system ATPase subunit